MIAWTENREEVSVIVSKEVVNDHILILMSRIVIILN